MLKHDERISVEREIAASAEKVRAQMALPAAVGLWHPFVKENTAESWNGIGSKDKLTYYNGGVFDKEVVNWLEGTGYDLKFTENGKNEAFAVWRITPIDDKSCKLKITAYIKFIEKFPFPIRWALLKFKMKPVFSQYLDLTM